MTNLRFTADHYAVPPLNIRPVESGIIPDHFSTGWKLIPLTTTSQNGPGQTPLYFRPKCAFPDQEPLIADPSIFPERERAGVESGSLVWTGLKASALKLSLCTYITRVDVMLDFICIGPVDLTGARRKRQNTKWKNSLSTVGLEPSTLRFQVWCSTYWASRAWWMLSV